MIVITQRWHRTRLRRAATRYALHGWPVVPGAVLIGDRYLCGPVCPTVSCHPVLSEWERHASCDAAQIHRWWSTKAHSVLLATGYAFDVLEVPARLAAPAVAEVPPGPVARTPTGTWMFLVSPGQPLRPELASRLDVVLHRRGSWIPAPPTRTPGDQVHWDRTPDAARWLVPDASAVQRALVEYAITVGATTVTPRHSNEVRPSGGPWDQRWSGLHRWAHRLGLPNRQRWSSRNVDTPVARSMS